MNKVIGAEIMKALNELSYIQKAGGIVQVVEKVDQGMGSGVKTYKLPASEAWMIKQDPSCITAPDVCGKAERLESFVPDTQLAAIAYCEDNGIKPGSVTGDRMNMTSSIRVVCWLNTPRISVGAKSYEVAAVVMAEVISKLRSLKNKSFPGVINLQVQISRIHAQDRRIFSAYSYEEPVHQHLMAPFQYFALDLDLAFRMPLGCLTTPGAESPFSIEFETN